RVTLPASPARVNRPTDPSFQAGRIRPQREKQRAGTREAAGVPFERAVSTGTEAVLFNARPLLLLAGAYLVVAAALVPAVWRDREGAHPLDVATVTIFPALAFTATLLAALVLVERRPLGGNVWLAFAAVAVALLPAILLLAR